MLTGRLRASVLLYSCELYSNWEQATPPPRQFSARAVGEVVYYRLLRTSVTALASSPWQATCVFAVQITRRGQSLRCSLTQNVFPTPATPAIRSDPNWRTCSSAERPWDKPETREASAARVDAAVARAPSVTATLWSRARRARVRCDG